MIHLTIPMWQVSTIKVLIKPWLVRQVFGNLLQRLSVEYNVSVLSFRVKMSDSDDFMDMSKVFRGPGQVGRSRKLVDDSVESKKTPEKIVESAERGHVSKETGKEERRAQTEGMFSKPPWLEDEEMEKKEYLQKSRRERREKVRALRNRKCSIVSEGIRRSQRKSLTRLVLMCMNGNPPNQLNVNCASTDY